jgi:hypothetical protein
VHLSAYFALVIKISCGYTRQFRVKMWGTSLPKDELAGDLGNVATSIGGRRFTAEKLAPGNLGLLQQISAHSGPSGAQRHARSGSRANFRDCLAAAWRTQATERAHEEYERARRRMTEMYDPFRTTRECKK